MTSRSHRRRRSGLVTPWTAAGVVTVVALAIGLAFAVAPPSSPNEAADGASAIVRTGETNSMGMPVIETPGEVTGSAAAAGIQVSAANWSLGTVPLNTAVRPVWLLRNTGDQPATVGEPHPEVREGCCPGPFSIAERTIAPGGETMLSFELSMHPGMDGWHDIAVHVPVTSGATQGVLELSVTGDFRN